MFRLKGCIQLSSALFTKVSNDMYTDLHAINDSLGQEALEAHLFLQVLKVGFLVQRYLRHVLEETPVAQDTTLFTFCSA